MQLYFIRHAQSENNALWERTGQSDGRSEDPELTELGWRQAKLVAEFLTKGSPVGGYGYEGDHQGEIGFGITHLYTSLMVRAVMTGTEIAQSLGLPLQAWEDLHEEGGIYLDDAETGEPIGLPGKDKAYFEENFPHLVLPEDMNESGWWGSRPFESREVRMPRVRRFLAELRQRHGDTQDRVAVVSHGGFFALLLTALLDLPARDGFWFTMYNTAITRIDFDGHEMRLVYQNRTDHLPVHLVT
jgi:2,3-bisphosphoglycerate-dependent phosphoglycerate mutase